MLACGRIFNGIPHPYLLDDRRSAFFSWDSVEVVPNPVSKCKINYYIEFILLICEG